MSEIQLQESRRSIVLKEAILENFMSYEYARIPFRVGMNLICGPNGAGKSSILLAISVALGQVYTERSKKLADLIRRGKEIARVTLVFDNSPSVDGKRPVPSIRSNELTLTRYMKIDGDYWYQINFSPASKAEVDDLLSQFGIDPDNMLIVMHQYMVEEFTVISPQQKLILVEKATGLSRLRDRVLESYAILRSVMSEEQSIKALLDEAQKTLENWRLEHEKLLRRRELLIERKNLQLEYAWALFRKQLSVVEALRLRLRSVEEEVKANSERVEKIAAEASEYREKLDSLRFEYRKLFFQLIEEERKELSGSNVEKIQERIVRTENAITKNIDAYVDIRIREALARHRLGELESERREVERRLSEASSTLEELRVSAESVGPIIEASRDPEEIRKDIDANQISIASLGTVLENASEMYDSYLKTFSDLKSKAEKVAENRSMVLKELDLRKEVWRKAVEGLLSRVNDAFRENMEKVGATGYVNFINPDDLENAGIELLVGFGGANPTALNYYTQSGGERSVSVIAFLLALQSSIVSPIRAVDEFDVHMDPRNREAFLRMIVEISKRNPDITYICITPGQIPPIIEGSSVLIVQNNYGVSTVGVVVKDAKG
ncbi:MAG: AAA family ATPase [Thermoproteota archaeon]